MMLGFKSEIKIQTCDYADLFLLLWGFRTGFWRKKGNLLHRDTNVLSILSLQESFLWTSDLRAVLLKWKNLRWRFFCAFFCCHICRLSAIHIDHRWKISKPKNWIVFHVRKHLELRVKFDLNDMGFYTSLMVFKQGFKFGVTGKLDRFNPVQRWIFDGSTQRFCANPVCAGRSWEIMRDWPVYLWYLAAVCSVSFQQQLLDQMAVPPSLCFMPREWAQAAISI